MSRTVISAVVAGVIIVLTVIAFFVTSTSYDDRARKDAEAQLERAHPLIQRLNQLQSIDVLNKAERLGLQERFVAAINLTGEDRRREANLGFLDFMANNQGAVKPDIIALVDKKGELIAMHEVPTVVPKQWLVQKDDGKPAEKPAPDKAGDKAADEAPETILPALNVVLRRKVVISDIWNYGDKMLKVGVAPIIDAYVTVEKTDPKYKNIIGAIVIAYAQTSKSAQQDKALLGTEIAYYDGKRVMASSFTRGAGAGAEEDTTKAKALSELLESGKLGAKATKVRVTIDGDDYFAATVDIPRKATKELPPPPEYPAITAGAVVLSPIVASPGAWTVKLFVIVLGVGAFAIAMLGLYLAQRRLVAQIEQVENGVTDIINGNVDRTFRPVGEEVEGLSNGLNVMLARLLGRPEPGEEDFDEEGNPIIPGRVEFEESGEGGESAPAPAGADPDLAALAQESEPDYYKRVYTEYLAAKRATGHPDEVSFENFIAKLKVNEGKLRAQYQCRAVRFRVVTKDGKVSLKPVPIFA